MVQKPTAELWQGQTDEGELGFSYEVADAVLKTCVSPLLLERRFQITNEEIWAVLKRVQRTRFKRQEKSTWRFPNRVERFI